MISVAKSVAHSVGRSILAGGITSVEVPKYFFSSTGDDANDGLSEAAPKQSLTALNSLVLAPGDIVGLKCGDSFNGQITIGQSGTSGNPIKITSYGTGAKPKIYGSELITGWTLHSGNIYKKVLANDITQLFVDGERATAARYPKTLYYDITTVNSTTQFISTEIASEAADYYKDATIILRDDPWSISSKTVTASTGQTITINAAPAGTLKVGWGFYMVGKLEFLTAAGEWFYDTATNTVYLWTPNGDTPDNYVVRGSIYDYGIFLDNSKDYVTVKNLDIREQVLYGVLIRESDNVVVDGCNIENVASQGVRIDELAGYATVQNCTIKNIQTYGIRSYGEFNTFDNNVITNIGLVENINQSGYFYGDAIYHSEGTGCQIKNNQIDSIGYIGIHFDELATYTTVENNTIKNAMLSLTDGGGIYCWVRPDLSKPVNNSIIRNNYIENMVGNLDGAVASSKAANGIYLDDRVADVEVYGNTVNGVAEYGLFLHNNIDANVYDNTFYNSGRSYYITHDFSAANNIVTNNTFYNIPESPSVNSIAARLGTLTSASAYTVADVDSNIYVDRTRSVPFRGAVDPYNCDFATWKSQTGWDAASTIYGTALGTGESQRLIVNTTTAAKTYYINNATAREIDGTAITTSFTLEAFESKIVEGVNLDCILDYEDSTAPAITEFIMPTSTTEAETAIISFVITGSPTQYLLNESATTPAINDDDWLNEIPTTYTFTSSGTKTLYAWAKDAAGNVSTSVSDVIEVSIESSLFTGLEALYEFESTGTTLLDETDNNLDGTNYQSTTPTTGNPGNAYLYSYATNRYTDFGDNDKFTLSGARTIAAWVNMTSIAATRAICSKVDGSNKEYYLHILTDGSISFGAYENNTTSVISANTPAGTIVTGNNYLIEVKLDATNRIRTGCEILVNGVSQTLTFGGNVTDLTVGMANTTAPFMIGQNTVSGLFFNGKISQVGIWSKELTPAEDTYLYNSGAGRDKADW